MSGHRPEDGAATGTVTDTATGTTAGTTIGATAGTTAATTAGAGYGATAGTAAGTASRAAALRAPAGRPRRPRKPASQTSPDPRDSCSTAPSTGRAPRPARPGPGRGQVPKAARPADPVRELMHRHRELCAHAVDSLEIAAALEADGITDRVAARFRHRDVFSLADELFARVPREEGRTSSAPGPVTATGTGTGAAGSSDSTAALCPPGTRRARPRVLLPLLAVLPGVLAAAALAVLASAGTGQGPGVARAGAATGVGLLCALAPAVWCARWFAVRARRGLERSRSLAEFAAGTRSLLTAAAVMFAGALTGLLIALEGVAELTGARNRGAAGGGPSGSGWPGGVLPGGFGSAETVPAAAALGLLLFAALLLVMHGFGGAAAAGLVGACALQAAAASAASAVAAGPAARAASVAACGCAALVLLACAYGLLGRASAHRSPDAAARARVKPPCRGVRRARGGPGGCCPRCDAREQCERPRGPAL